MFQFDGEGVGGDGALCDRNNVELNRRRNRAYAYRFRDRRVEAIAKCEKLSL
jgi:hypothetical protein